MKLINKTFSRKDYKDLDEDQIKELKSKRKHIAKKILEERKATKSFYNRALGDINKNYESSVKGEIFGKRNSDGISADDIKEKNLDKAKKYLKDRYDKILSDASKEKKKASRYVKSSKFKKDNEIYKNIKNSKKSDMSIKRLLSKIKSPEDIKNIIKGLSKSQKAAIGATAATGIGYSGYRLAKNYKEKKELDKVRKHILGNKD